MSPRSLTPGYLFLGLLLLAGIAVAAEPPANKSVDKPESQHTGLRTWTDITGKHKIEAEFVEVKDGKVRLKKVEGKVLSVAIEKLSEADQEFVDSQVGQVGKKRKPVPPVPTEKERITLEQLRKKPPLLGLCLADAGGDKFMDLYISRAQAIKPLHVDAWLAGLNKMGFALTGLELVKPLPEIAGFPFQGSNINEDVHKRAVKRLNTIRREQCLQWSDALRTDQAWFVAVMLTAVDQLYDESDRYDAQKAVRYLKRLKGISDQHVDLWCSKMHFRYFLREDAKISITLVDDFFQDDRFDENAFKAILK